MGFSSQEYWSGLPFPSPGDLPDPGIEPIAGWGGGGSPALRADALTSELALGQHKIMFQDQGEHLFSFLAPNMLGFTYESVAVLFLYF